MLAALTGAGLAMTGALLQTTTRNELADPFCLVSPQAPPPARCWSSPRFGDALGALTLPLSAFAGGVFNAVMICFASAGSRAQLIVCGWRSRFCSARSPATRCFRQRAAGWCCSGRSAGWGWRVGIICPFRWRVSCCWPGLRRCVGGRWTRCWRASKPPIRWGSTWRACAPRPFCAAHCPRRFSFR
ncbi:iron chelate uptake ABC transporter family permease subunit [Serratia marcescens]|uniref:Iron chelate uptake ABC transporter family permease subunit n=1 Tax=Serratia marcescens TaxID=615 RepID=A0A939NQE4_SERMA|nr:iron chelate uptake ABC transporter family permease subunit [Serratia marcescens]